MRAAALTSPSPRSSIASIRVSSENGGICHAAAAAIAAGRSGDDGVGVCGGEP